jgi:hypothetical protein
MSQPAFLIGQFSQRIDRNNGRGNEADFSKLPDAYLVPVYYLQYMPTINYNNSSSNKP